MLITAPGQLATPSGAAELRDQILRDINLGAIAAGIPSPPVQPNSDWFLLASSLANELLILYANQSIGLAAQNILTATGKNLDTIRLGLGLPEVTASGSTGTIVIRVFSATTIVDGQQFVLPNGLRGKVVGTYVNPADFSEVNVATIDTGSATNLASKQVVRFVSPPSGIGTDAVVSDGQPLTGGTDVESDERKRARILDALRNKPAGGNWSHIRQIVLAALGSVQDCYIYPALGGPASAKVVPVRAFDPLRNSYTRSLSASALATVRGAIQAQLPTPMEIVVQASADQNIELTLLLKLPDSTLNGGNGLGWTDYPVWPLLVGGDSGRVRISAVNSTFDVITVTAGTAAAPTPGSTHISWWSPVDHKFYDALVVGQTGTPGAWVLTLDRALVSSDGSGVAVNDYISPSAHNTPAYAAAWLSLFQQLGPGENTSDVNRLPRSLRHPFKTDEDPSELNYGTLSRWVAQFQEISNFSVGYTSVSALAPDVPGTVDLAPNILVPKHFAIYST